MFALLRRYQRAIFLAVTVVIILSFSFFGTYSSFSGNVGEDSILFTTVHGRKVYRSEFNEYVRFLSADNTIHGEGSWFNALNDGVLAREIIDSGVGEAIATQLKEQFAKEWMQAFGREKKFKPYQHPQAPFVSAAQVWNYFAPQMKEAFDGYQILSTIDPIEVYKAKKELFLSEREFPPMHLRQILGYQQKQFQWLEPDPSLESRSLGLFGYHQISDWFGSSFIDRSCEWVIQAASFAKSQGIVVSKAEVLASLYQNVQKSLQKFPRSENMKPEELFRKTLRELNMDEARLIKIWSDVLLFRRVLTELPFQLILSARPFEPFFQQQFQKCDFECFQVRPELRFQSMRDLMKFEIWLRAVSKKADNSLALPSEFLSPSKVQASWPELVERRFTVRVFSTSLQNIEKQIRLRDIWEWQIVHFEDLKVDLLKEKVVATREEKLRLLESLPAQVRSKVDDMAKAAIVQQHPEWITALLDKSEVQTHSIGIRLQGGDLPLEGLKDRQALITQLLSNDKLESYTQDGIHHYRIEVVDRDEESRLVPFPDLMKDGTLERLLDRLLEAFYVKAKKDKPAEFRNEKKEFLSFQEAKVKIADYYFSSFELELDKCIQVWKKKLPKYCHWDDQNTARVAVRFLPHLVEKVANESFSYDEKNLFDIESSSQTYVRHEKRPQFSEFLEKREGDWLLPKYDLELGPFIAKIGKKGVEEYSESVRAAVYGTRESIGREMVSHRAKDLTTLFFPKGE